MKKTNGLFFLCLLAAVILASGCPGTQSAVRPGQQTEATAETTATTTETTAAATTPTTPATPDFTGIYQGEIRIGTNSLELALIFVNDEGVLKTFLTIPQANAQNVLLENVDIMYPEIILTIPAAEGSAIIEATFNGTSLNGSFQQGAAIGVFTAEKISDIPQEVYDNLAMARRIVQEEYSLTTETGTITGLLMTPRVDHPIPVALIIAGSGPTDGNGNNPSYGGSNNCLQMLALTLMEHDIATVRYDKRGVGSSADAIESEADLNVDVYVSDAAGFIARLDADPRFSHVVVIGHDEGSLIGMLASQSQAIDALISIGGYGRRMDSILLEQFAALPADLLSQVRTVINDLVEDRTVTTMDTRLATYFRQSIQPYLISLFNFNPATEIARLSIPILLVRGTSDLQIAGMDTQNLLTANPQARFAEIAGMNHVLKDAPADNPQTNFATYSNATLPLSPGLVPALLSFIETALSVDLP